MTAGSRSAWTTTGRPSPTSSSKVAPGWGEYADDADETLHWATRVGARYMGEERAEAFGRRNAVPGELLVRVTIDKVISEAGVTD